mgnify:CR=1 FL=1
MNHLLRWKRSVFALMERLDRIVYSLVWRAVGGHRSKDIHRREPVVVEVFNRGHCEVCALIKRWQRTIEEPGTGTWRVVIISSRNRVAGLNISHRIGST